MKNKKKLLGLLAVFFLLIAMAVPAGAATKWLDTRVCGVHQKIKISLDSMSTSYNTGYKWSSSNTSVATVSKKGVVYCKKKGHTTITAKDGLAVYKINLTVGDKLQPAYPYFVWNDCWIKIQYITSSKIAVTIHNKSSYKRSFRITKLKMGKHTYNISMKSVSLYGNHETHLVLKRNVNFKNSINLSDTIDESSFTMWRKSA